MTNKQWNVLAGICVIVAITIVSAVVYAIHLNFVNAAASAAKAPERQSAVTVTNVGKIVMHSPSGFTFFVEQPSGKIGMLSIQLQGGVKANLLKDAKPEEPISVSYDCAENGCEPIPSSFTTWAPHAATLTIHVHSASELVLDQFRYR